jgi:hypothetical protein
MEEQEVKTPEKVWEYKDRNYYLLGDKQPLTYTLPCKHSQRYPLVWFDSNLGYERELRYATNQKSIFVDKQEGSATLKHIVFEKGHLFVPKEKRNLQEFLEYHPHKNLIFKEFKREMVAANEVDLIELEVEALNIAMQLDVEEMEAVLRVEVGSNVAKMSSKELKRDLLRFTKRSPALFLDLVNDENIMLRNFGIRACEARIIKLSQDQRTFTWASNGRKLMNVPFEENPYSALAVWFQTDEGLEVYKSIEKKFK